MRVFVFVNRVQEIGVRQTTALLIAAFHRGGHEVFLANVDGLSITCCASANTLDCIATPEPESEAEATGPIVFTAAIKFDPSNTSKVCSQSVAAFCKAITESRFLPHKLTKEDLLLIRTNPGRDTSRFERHRTFIELCRAANRSGFRVVNDPANLGFFASKAAVALLPKQFRPQMLVTQDPAMAKQFIVAANRDCVVKPLNGSRGNDVIRLSSNSNRIESELVRFRNRNIVVQHFVESEEPGDKRVVIINGKLMEHNSYLAGIHRIPAEGEFRGNIHAGGTALPLSLNEDQKEAVLAAASVLQEAGIQLAGVDLVGNKVIEFNVFSTGGLFDANRFAKFDFAEQVALKLVHN